MSARAAERMRLLADMLENGIETYATIHEAHFVVTMTQEQARAYLRFILTDVQEVAPQVMGFHAEGDCP